MNERDEYKRRLSETEKERDEYKLLYRKTEAVLAGAAKRNGALEQELVALKLERHGARNRRRRSPVGENKSNGWSGV